MFLVWRPYCSSDLLICLPLKVATETTLVNASVPPAPSFCSLPSSSFYFDDDPCDESVSSIDKMLNEYGASQEQLKAKEALKEEAVITAVVVVPNVSLPPSYSNTDPFSEESDDPAIAALEKQLTALKAIKKKKVEQEAVESREKKEQEEAAKKAQALALKKKEQAFLLASSEESEGSFSPSTSNLNLESDGAFKKKQQQEAKLRAQEEAAVARNKVQLVAEKKNAVLPVAIGKKKKEERRLAPLKKKQSAFVASATKNKELDEASGISLLGEVLATNVNQTKGGEKPTAKKKEEQAVLLASSEESEGSFSPSTSNLNLESDGAFKKKQQQEAKLRAQQEAAVARKVVATNANQTKGGEKPTAKKKEEQTLATLKKKQSAFVASATKKKDLDEASGISLLGEVLATNANQTKGGEKPTAKKREEQTLATLKNKPSKKKELDEASGIALLGEAQATKTKHTTGSEKSTAIAAAKKQKTNSLQQTKDREVEQRFVCQVHGHRHIDLQPLLNLKDYLKPSARFVELTMLLTSSHCHNCSKQVGGHDSCLYYCLPCKNEMCTVEDESQGHKLPLPWLCEPCFVAEAGQTGGGKKLTRKRKQTSKAQETY
jgi:hypothetical protein